MRSIFSRIGTAIMGLTMVMSFVGLFSHRLIDVVLSAGMLVLLLVWLYLEDVSKRKRFRREMNRDRV